MWQKWDGHKFIAEQRASVRLGRVAMPDLRLALHLHLQASHAPGRPARELLCKMARRALSPHSPVRRPHKIKQNKGINLQCAHPRALRPVCGIGASALAPAFGYLAGSLAGPRRLGGLASQWLARAPKQT